jgi:Microtubule-associated protein 70
MTLISLQNLEIKKINEEKKAALAAQFAAEATLRRVHAAQKDDDMPPIEAILAPLEAELKLARSEVLIFPLSFLLLTNFFCKKNSLLSNCCRFLLLNISALHLS